ncbi:MAG TPA: serine/threonine-protein kinase [Gemmatimonadales bacterium]|nr:serine/threonine-protein kinase [Gemmatimonadales bacterium]
MPAPNLIGPEPHSTPSSQKSGGGAPRPLPDDLLREASRRLGIFALMGAALWTTGTLLDKLAQRAMNPTSSAWRTLDVPDLIAGAGLLVSLAMYRYTRRTGRVPQRCLDVGLLYLVFTALAIGLLWHWHAVPSDWPPNPVITWVGAVILMFPAIVPTPPRKMLVAGLISAAMMPAGMLIAKARGAWDFGSDWNALLMHYPDFMLVGVAVVISHVVTRLGHQVSKARELGSYQIGELLGRGGMGEVYLARHRMLARPAAIKLIRPEMIASGGDDAARLAISRFRREAEVAANLRSPHTVELYDFGVTEDQTLYFVMELLEGMNLEQLVRTSPRVDPARVIHILRQVCESLEEAHVRGLVHRDIKPANIHIGRLGLTHDFVKVLDFGLVKSMAGTTGEQSLATGTGITPGTPDYMAPEMLMGNAIDGRADLYALGCVAYNLLTGVPVFEGPGVFALIAKHLNEVPVSPSARADIVLPDGLERLVLACLAKDPPSRPASAAALGRALAALDLDPWTQDDAAAWWAAQPRVAPVPSTT